MSYRDISKYYDTQWQEQPKRQPPPWPHIEPSWLIDSVGTMLALDDKQAMKVLATIRLLQIFTTVKPTTDKALAAFAEKITHTRRSTDAEVQAACDQVFETLWAGVS